MAVHYTPLTNGQDANATTFNAPLQELDDAIEDLRDGTLAHTAIDVNGGAIDGTPIGASSAAAGNFTTIDASGVIEGAGLVADADPGSGSASKTTYTDATDTPTTDPGWTTSSTVNMNAPDGYIKLYVGTQAVVVPYWNT